MLPMNLMQENTKEGSSPLSTTGGKAKNMWYTSQGPKLRVNGQEVNFQKMKKMLIFWVFIKEYFYSLFTLEIV
jgi:hypothetical protein